MFNASVTMPAKMSSLRAERRTSTGPPFTASCLPAAEQNC